MRNIFELTKPERRVVIVIVMLLVAIAFARHAWQTKSVQPVKAPPAETSSPLGHEPHGSSDKSRN